MNVTDLTRPLELEVSLPAGWRVVDLAAERTAALDDALDSARRLAAQLVTDGPMHASLVASLFQPRFDETDRLRDVLIASLAVLVVRGLDTQDAQVLGRPVLLSDVAVPGGAHATFFSVGYPVPATDAPALTALFVFCSPNLPLREEMLDMFADIVRTAELRSGGDPARSAARRS